MVAAKANRLANHADYEPLVPLYEKSVPFNVVESVSVSSEYSQQYRADKAVDGIMTPEGEWSSKGEQTPWIRIDLEKGMRVDRVVLYDKANDIDNARGGTLRFSDGGIVGVFRATRLQAAI